ncbi:MAG TPA: hypothetical protein PLV25_03470, partial [Opitutales bacterium]|nr:hypothetical protein [Opitutales bacterium]
METAKTGLTDGDAQTKELARDLLLQFANSPTFTPQQRIDAASSSRMYGDDSTKLLASDLLLQLANSPTFTSQQRIDAAFECVMHGDVSNKLLASKLFLQFANSPTFTPQQRIDTARECLNCEDDSTQLLASKLLLQFANSPTFTPQQRIDAARDCFIYGDNSTQLLARDLLLQFANSPTFPKEQLIDAARECLMCRVNSTRLLAATLLVTLVLLDPDTLPDQRLAIARIIVDKRLPEDSEPMQVAMQIIMDIGNRNEDPPFIRIHREADAMRHEIASADIAQYTQAQTVAGHTYTLATDYIGTQVSSPSMPLATHAQLQALGNDLNTQVQALQPLLRSRLERLIGASIQAIQAAIESPELMALMAQAAPTAAFNRTAYELKAVVNKLTQDQVAQAQLDPRVVEAPEQLGQALAQLTTTLTGLANQNISQLPQDRISALGQQLDAFNSRLHHYAETGILMHPEAALSNEALAMLEQLSELPRAEGTPKELALRTLAENAEGILNQYAQSNLTPTALNTLAFMRNVLTCRSGKGAGIHSGFVNRGLQMPVNDEALQQLITDPGLKTFLSSREETNVALQQSIYSLAQAAYNDYRNSREAMLDGDGPLVRSFTEGTFLPAPSHERDFVKLVLAERLGLISPGERLPVDRHGEVVDIRLRNDQMTGTRMLAKYLELYTPDNLITKFKHTWTEALRSLSLLESHRHRLDKTLQNKQAEATRIEEQITLLTNESARSHALEQLALKIAFWRSDAQIEARKAIVESDIEKFTALKHQAKLAELNQELAILNNPIAQRPEMLKLQEQVAFLNNETARSAALKDHQDQLQALAPELEALKNAISGLDEQMHPAQ